uniref:Uncharacterized protein n=1 Tax=Setaria digitata TaxID=48799 RepID=A0A915Q3E3_9BILA
MFTQREEHWKEGDDLFSSEYRRRITHEDICNCDNDQFAISYHRAAQASSQDWRKSTDYCSGFSDYAPLYPADLWFQNDLKRIRRQSLQRCCNCCSNCCRKQQRNYCKEYQCDDVNDYSHDYDTAFDSTYLSDHITKSSENLKTIRVIPVAFVSSLASKNMVDATRQSGKIALDTDSGYLNAIDASNYGPFMARKIRITPAIMELLTRRYQTTQEHRSTSERKYLREIQNNEYDVTKRVAFVNETHDESDDSRIKFDDYHDITSKLKNSEFEATSLSAPRSSKIPILKNSNLLFTKTIDECKLPKKYFRKNSFTEECNHESGRDTLMEGLALLKDRKKEQETKKTFQTTPSDNYFGVESIHSETIPKIREYSNNNNKQQQQKQQQQQQQQQQSAIKRIATYWHKKTFKKFQQTERCSPKPESKYNNLINKQVDDDDLVRRKLIAGSNANNSSDNKNNINSNESKFIMEIRHARENLRKISKHSALIDNCEDATKFGIISNKKG